MKTIPGFKRFIKYNNVDDDSMRIAANLLRHQRIEKNTYLFKQDDKSDHFYGIIQGKISIRENVKILQNTEEVQRSKI